MASAGDKKDGHRMERKLSIFDKTGDIMSKSQISGKNSQDSKTLQFD